MKVTMKKRRIRAVLILVSWIIPIGIFYPYFQFSRKAEEAERPLPCGTDMSSVADIIYHTIFVVFYHCVLLVSITILRFFSIKNLRSNIAINENRHINITRHKQRQRIMKLLISIIVFFFICWTTNYTIVMFFEFSNDFKEYKPETLFLVGYYFLPFLSTAANPVILFTFSTNYLQALKSCSRLAFVTFRSCAKGEQTALSEENFELPALHAQ